MHPIEKEDDRNAFAGIVVMVAAEKEAIGIVWIVVTEIVLQVQI